jgi:hypothetical protein
MREHQVRGLPEGQLIIDQEFFLSQFGDPQAEPAQNDTVKDDKTTDVAATAAGDVTAATDSRYSSVQYRTFDGTDNNLANPSWGAAGTPLLRIAAAAYADGKSALAVRGCPERTNPRNISNLICRQSGDKPNRNRLSDFVWTWGQFLDHELDLTGTGEEDASFAAPANDPLAAGASIEFKRSQFDPATGDDEPRQQINLLPAYIDASNVYGNSRERADKLRRHDGTGRLRVTASPYGYGDLLPFDEDTGNTGQPLFIAGDVRANEHAVLTSMHTLFLREHNRLCLEILAHDPNLAGQDETIYQQARKIVGGIMQAITYNEFLPTLLGAGALSPYNGYKPHVNAGIANVFSTAAYRLGHSMLTSRLQLGNGERTLLLRDAFFNPRWVIYNGIEPFLAGRAAQVMQAVDTRIIEDVRSFLFGAPPPVGEKLLDLAALNIQRGRDHGLPDYNSCRKAYGLSGVVCFSDITRHNGLQDKLEYLYQDVDHIDPWIGALAEDPVGAGNVGEFIVAVLKDQFERLRDGDRFWFEIDDGLSSARKAEIAATRLADVIRRNTSIDAIQANVFVVE